MQVRLEIEGMHCAGCVRAVQNVLSRVDQVKAVEVRLDQGDALITAADGLDTAALVAAVDDAGYQARVTTD